MIRGMCEDYRAAASIDLVHDKLSRKMGAKIICPLLLYGVKMEKQVSGIILLKFGQIIPDQV